MSGIKPPELAKFYRSIEARSLTTEILADFVGCSRPALCRVLNGSRRRGPIWQRVERVLTQAEIDLLDVAHRSPWNEKRRIRQPRWVEAAARICA